MAGVCFEMWKDYPSSQYASAGFFVVSLVLAFGFLK